MSIMAIASRIIRDEGLEVARAFVAQVNAHIDALTAWQERLAIIARETALRGTPEPMPSDCDSEAAFLSAHRFWQEAHTIAHHWYPAPSAPIRVERAIEVHTAADGSRTYTYLDDEWGNSVCRDIFIQRSKR
jgi:hypothetical protein